MALSPGLDWIVNYAQEYLEQELGWPTGPRDWRKDYRRSDRLSFLLEQRHHCQLTLHLSTGEDFRAPAVDFAEEKDSWLSTEVGEDLRYFNPAHIVAITTHMPSEEVMSSLYREAAALGLHEPEPSNAVNS